MTGLLGRRAVAVVAATAATVVSAMAVLLGIAAPAFALDGNDGSAAQLTLAAPRLVVCAKDSADRVGAQSGSARALNEALLRECSYDTVQAAVDAVYRRGTTIYLLPGKYHDATVTIAGGADCVRCDLRLEGTGNRPEEVLIEGGRTADDGWSQRVGIHAEHANGLYLRNFTTQRYSGSGVEVVWTDGFVIDHVIGRWNGSYGLAAFATDHGVLTDCTATGNSGAGIAMAPVTNVAGARPTVEVRRCQSRGNLIGLAGGDSVYVHDNDFSGNAVGITAESRAWQSHGSFIANRVHDNNVNPYGNVWSGRCAKPPWDRPRDLICPSEAVPVGTGLQMSGGGQNTYAGNLVYGNWRAGVGQLAYARGNRWLGNLMGFSPSGTTVPNGIDFWWDGTGDHNCWQDNASSWGGVRSKPQSLPDCAHPSGAGAGAPSWEILAACASYVPATSSSPKGFRPAGCDWVKTPPRPAPR